MTRALLVLSDGFEDIEAVAVIDVLTRVGVEVVVASLKPGPVRAAYGTTLIADATLDSISGDFDAVICPGGKVNAKSLAADEGLRTLLKSYNDQGRLIAAICAAPSHVLGESAGLLSGRCATGDPGFREKLAASGAMVCDEPVCSDGNLITASGPGSALQFALTIAAQLKGEDAVRPFARKWGVEYIVP